MKHLNHLIFLPLFSILSACNGNSSTDNNSINSNPSTIPVGTLCTSKESIILSGIEINVAGFDTDNNGCLYPDELSNAYRYADKKAAEKLELKSLHIEGTNHSDSVSSIIKATGVGSSELSNELLQLHPNIDDGRFYIKLELNNRDFEGETLRVFFDDESYTDKQNTPAPISFDTKPPLTGLTTLIVACSYLSDFSIHCEALLTYPTGTTPQNSVLSKTIDISYNLNNTFSEVYLPQAGNIIISYCTGIEDESKCFNNFVEIGTSFN